MKCHFIRIRIRWLRIRLNSFVFILCLLLIAILAPAAYYKKPSVLSSILPESYRRFERYLFSNYTITRDTFVPGKFLNSLKRQNVSYCNFRFSLPNSLNIPENEVKYSPQMGKLSSYRVVDNVLQPEESQKENVTLCTHATPEFFYYLAELLKRWQGPVSISVFVPGSDAGLLVCFLDQLCHCLQDMSRVSLHFIFPQDHPPTLSSCPEIPKDCSPPKFASSLPTYRYTKDLTYPINVARNVARSRAKTSFVLVSDIELFPSENLVFKFVTMMNTLRSKSRSSYSTFLNRIVYVVPVFEIELYEEIPKLKSQLISLYSQNKAFYFHRWVCSHCQRFPGLQRWILRTKESLDNNIEPFFVVRREYPFHRWEPVFIGSQSEPLYSELLTWEGQQDKMTQMHEMCLLEYRFVILDGAFLVHSPGVKRRGTNSSNQRQDKVAANSRHYDSIIRRLSSRIKGNPRCRSH